MDGEQLLSDLLANWDNVEFGRTDPKKILPLFVLASPCFPAGKFLSAVSLFGTGCASLEQKVGWRNEGGSHPERPARPAHAVRPARG